ncbi:MAG: DNA topoisomerase IB [Gemmataceae bacterium]|nr:DNA topoisomerase IB [Gemmataceae bacterium]
MPALRHTSDSMLGLRRLKRGKGFRYLRPDGAAVTDAQELARIKALAIPPAWRKVWICPHANGHLQATGLDARGRKQYRYHPEWTARRGQTKYARLAQFGAALPAIRERLEEHLALPGMPRERVLAAIVRLLDTTLIRVGNEEYARTNGSFGLTTLRNRHAIIEGTTLRFRFKGKSGVMHDVELKDRRLAALVRRCRDLPGQELFQWLDEKGEPHGLGSADVNEYLREVSGLEITAKDFRTWGGTVLALRALREAGACPGEAEGKKAVVAMIERVAKGLRNTPAVCRKCYVHPTVCEAWLAGKELPEEAALAAWLAEG